MVTERKEEREQSGHTCWQHLVTPGNTMPTEHFCLKWNNYQTNIVSALGNLKLDGDFVDVTLSCEGRKIEAHKVILSACSDYFRDVFRVSERENLLNSNIYLIFSLIQSII